MKNKKLFLIFANCILCFCLAGCSISTGTPIRISGGQVSTQPAQMESVTIDTVALNRVFEQAGKGQDIDLKEIENMTQNGVKQSGFEIVQNSNNNAIELNLGGLGGMSMGGRRKGETVVKKDGFITIDIRTDNLQDFFNTYVK